MLSPALLSVVSIQGADQGFLYANGVDVNRLTLTLAWAALR